MPLSLHRFQRVVEGLRRPILLGCIAPAQAIAIDEYYAAQYTPVIDARLALALWKEAFQTRHLRVRRPEKIAHRSVSVRGLTHAASGCSMGPVPKLLKKAMLRHGRPETLVTDRLRSYGAALKDMGRSDDRGRGVGSTTGPKTRTSLSDDGSGRCCGSGACARCRSSPQTMPWSTTAFRRSATSKITSPVSKPAPPLSLSGAVYSLPDPKSGLG